MYIGYLGSHIACTEIEKTRMYIRFLRTQTFRHFFISTTSTLLYSYRQFRSQLSSLVKFVMVAEIAIKLFSLVDSIVELYLGTVIKPFLSLHEKFYSSFNTTLRKLLDDNKSQIADWFTANFITYARTVLVVPTLLLLALGHTFLPSIIVILVDFGDFLDGVVARYWVDVQKEREQEESAAHKDKGSSRPTSPLSDDDSFGTLFIAYCFSDETRHFSTDGGETHDVSPFLFFQ